MLLLRIGLAAGLTAAVLGCSSSVAPGRVRGTISYKGQLVKAGTVYFMYEHGGQYRAEIKPDGSYQFIDLPVGEAKVVIDTEPFNPDQKVQVYNQQSQQYAKGMAKSISEYNATMGKGEATKKGPATTTSLSKERREELAKVYVKLPKKYADEKTTPLTYTVERGSQTKDFDLTD